MKSMFEKMLTLNEARSAAGLGPVDAPPFSGPHLACYDCQGTGTTEDTLGNYRTCHCVSDIAFRRRLDNLARAGTVMVTTPKPPDQLTEWDL